MVLPFVLIVAILLMFIQLYMALRVKNRYLRLLPVYIVGGCELACVISYIAGLLTKIPDISFTAFILCYIGCYWAAGTVLGWGTAAIVKRIQKRGK